ncbi:MAG: hypothetical protein HRT46_11515 [Deltaproteobacteria bacterium]|nr:hypothetical protein [Deltaproteobacteria bacterium]
MVATVWNPLETVVEAGDDSSRTFDVFWAGKTPADVQRKRGDLAAEIDFGLAPVSRNMVILYAYQAGRYPYAGPHELKLDPEWMDRHFQRLERMLDRHIPDPDFDGYATIHYESWDVLWELLGEVESDEDASARDLDYKADWRDYIEEHEPQRVEGLSADEREEVFAETYEETAREFLLDTLRECKRLRPDTKWSYDYFPHKIYRLPELTDEGVLGYGDLSHRASELNDELEWLWEEMDFISSNLYQIKYTLKEISNNKDGSYNTKEANAEFMWSNILERLRVASGKPVYVMLWSYYGGAHRDTYLNKINRRQTLEIPLLAGADGVIIWHSVHGRSEQRSFQKHVRSTLVKEILRLYNKHDIVPSEHNNLPSWLDGPKIVRNSKSAKSKSAKSKSKSKKKKKKKKDKDKD